MQSFWDSYESTIHSNVKGFAMTNANYAHAFDLLQERFSQQQKITNKALQALLELPAYVRKVRMDKGST